MSAMIIPFVGTAGWTAERNLAEFIAHAKRYRWFGPGPNQIDWHSNTWDLLPFKSTRGRPPGFVIHFTNYETARRGNRAKDAVDMPQPFLDAAKAIIVEFARTTNLALPGKFVTALRIIEKSFRDLGIEPNVCDMTPAVLDHAAEMARNDLIESWSCGRALERIADEFVNRAQLSHVQLLWKSPLKYQGAKRNDRVNKEGGAGERSDKLPHLKCILDLASVFHTSKYVPDRIVTSWFALAMYAPSRATEILTLPLKSVTEMEGVFGIGISPLKGGKPMTKFATTDEWAEVAQEAIRRLGAMGEKARTAAKWYEDHPGQLYLPSGFEHLRGQPLTRWEICQILGKSRDIVQGSGIDRALERTGKSTSDPARTGGRSRVLLSTFTSVEQYVMSVLPPDFPYVDQKNGLKFSEALFCVPLHILRGDGDTQEYVPSLVSYSQIKHELGSKPTGETIASRNNLLDPKTGKPWKLNTHQPRHLLNTLAQSKHLSQSLIAFWSGRKKVSQNDWYNHIPQEAVIDAFLKMGEQAPKELSVIGPLDEKVAQRARKEMITYEEALRLELGSTINTRFGMCRHNYSLTPCPKDKNCIGCGENTFIKGDERHLAEARNQLAINQGAADRCRLHIADGEPDVERWLHGHEEKAERWKMAIERITDPSLPDGTLITLEPPAHSQSKAGLSASIRAAEFDDSFDGLERFAETAAL